jgi:hypothetical protein
VAALALVTLVVVHGPVTIDWTRGVVSAEAGAGPSLRAPSPTVARAAAERLARDLAARRLLEAVHKLPVVGGGTVGQQLSAGGREALEKSMAALTPRRLRYASDGGIELQLSLPLARVAQALPVRRAEPEDAEKAAAHSSARIAIATGPLEPALVPRADLRFFGSLPEAKKERAWLGDSPRTIKIRRLGELDARGGPVAVVVGR